MSFAHLVGVVPLEKTFSLMNKNCEWRMRLKEEDSIVSISDAIWSNGNISSSFFNHPQPCTRIHLRHCMGSQISGTIVCLLGAILMSLTQTIGKDSTKLDENRAAGALCLISAVIILSFIIMLQARIMSGFLASIDRACLCIRTLHLFFTEEYPGSA